MSRKEKQANISMCEQALKLYSVFSVFSTCLKHRTFFLFFVCKLLISCVTANGIFFSIDKYVVGASNFARTLAT